MRIFGVPIFKRGVFGVDVMDMRNTQCWTVDFYQSILGASPVGYAYHQMAWDDLNRPCKTTFLEVNQAFEDFTGIKAGSVIEKNTKEKSHNMNRETLDFLSPYADMALQGGRKEWEHYVLKQERWYRITACSLEAGYFVTFLTDISQEKEQLRKLETVHQKMDLLIKNIHVLIFVLDKNLVFQDYHQPVQDQLIMPPEFFIGKKFDEIGFPEPACSIIQEALEKSLQSQEIVRAEYTLLVDKKNLWFDLNITPLFSETRENIGLVGVARDITEKRRMEEKIKMSEENFRTFFETMDDIVLVANREGHVFYANGSFCKKLGYTREEILGMHVVSFQPPEKREEAEKIFSEMLGGMRDFCPLSLLRKDGRCLPVETRIWFGNWDGQPCIFGVFKDLSIQQAALDKFHKLFDSNPALMAVTSVTDGKFIEVNEAFLKNLGYAKEEVIGKTAKDLDLFLEPDKQTGASHTLKKDKKLRNLELHVRKKDGKIMTGLFSGEVIDNQKEQAFLTVMTDITEQKKAEGQCIVAKEKAESASTAKSQFLANMSHEIRTPMNAIMGFLELLLYTPVTEEQGMFIKEAKTASENLLQLLNNILDISKMEAGKFSLEHQWFHLRTLVEEACSLFSRKAQEKQVALYLLVKPNVPELVMGDPVKLRQIVNNLLSNAVKFTHFGEISVTVESLEDSAEGFYTIQFEVKDTGIGISQKDTGQIFMPFIQGDGSTTRKYGGTGLGLSISKELIKMMDGDIYLDSKKDEGSVFTFTVRLQKCPKNFLTTPPTNETLDGLGVSIGDENPNNRHTEEESKYGGQHTVHSEKAKPRILVVEDNLENVKWIIGMLKNKDYVCDVAYDGLEGLHAVQEKRYDLVFMNGQLPLMDGYLATKKIRESEGEKRRTPIVALISNASKRDVGEVFDAGMDDYISLPIDCETFTKMLEKYTPKEDLALLAPER
jgi:PAS domain S-box-containing protein